MQTPTTQAGALTPVISLHPVTLSVPNRPVDLELRISAPISGTALPILLLSHGHGPSNFVSSLYGYGPLGNYYAARGFVVIQPTHLDSKTLPFRSSDHPDAPLFWRSRAEDMTHIVDRLDLIERVVPTLAGRVDRSQLVVVGHSMGGHTASVLLGARHQDPNDGRLSSLREPRIRAGVLLAAPGRGDALSEFAAEHYPFFATIDFSSMTTPALVVAGADDGSPHLTTAGAEWHIDPYSLSPGPKSLIVVRGGQHGLGGIAGYDLAETTDENPARVAVVQHLSWAYLRSQLRVGDPAWQDALNARAAELSRNESK